ncbi:fumarylacetoacetate hydrolase family protein [Oryzicola mucosus]|uniref:Fumarylacetoacetase N-terminal domain-containing protein n=1 Tax=Oryzicola mucosus TaxID=2767425 RepID=A0A8J6U104_9HYPH|nr:hypothetical protein [Oryzicola mucosus]MBD0416381.1 hypothetical protein [Oryzicola mucosus]
MKLASLKDGSRDGKLVVVSRDLTRYTDASFLVPTLQRALDDWNRIVPHLQTLAQSLELGAVPWQRFHEHDALSPLPRAYQRVGGGDAFIGPRDDVVLPSAEAAIQAGLAAITLDIPVGEADAARDGIALMMLSVDIVVGGEAGVSAFSPVAVTPDEIEGAEISVLQSSNGKAVAETSVSTDFGEVLEKRLNVSALSAGAVVGRPAGGAKPLAEGDLLRLEAKGSDGHSIFGAIEQKASRKAVNTPLAA